MKEIKFSVLARVCDRPELGEQWIEISGNEWGESDLISDVADAFGINELDDEDFEVEWVALSDDLSAYFDEDELDRCIKYVSLCDKHGEDAVDAYLSYFGRYADLERFEDCYKGDDAEDVGRQYLDILIDRIFVGGYRSIDASNAMQELLDLIDYSDLAEQSDYKEKNGYWFDPYAA